MTRYWRSVLGTLTVGCGLCAAFVANANTTPAQTGPAIVPHTHAVPAFQTLVPDPPAVPITMAVPPVQHLADVLTYEGTVIPIGGTVGAPCNMARPLVPHDGNAYLDTCLSPSRGVDYLVGHAPGPFTPFRTTPIGAAVALWDADGVPHPYHVIAAHTFHRLVPAEYRLPTPGTHVELQTCMTDDATVIRVLDLG